MKTARYIGSGNAVLGIEIGSTRIKAVLIGEGFEPIASGSYAWENSFENGVWTYSLHDVRKGMRNCYADLAADVEKRYGVTITRLKAVGISGMMHGYLPFDENMNQLCEFRTWRNTTTEKAAKELTELFDFNIPLRWSIAHLYHAILCGEPHVRNIHTITTVAGYVNRLLGGAHAVGICEASGMFPIEGGGYNRRMLDLFDNLIADKGYSWKTEDILPKVLAAGESSGILTDEGAAFLDVSGRLKGGAILCAPEGDAATGMAATNSVMPRTGNVSAGTSVFSMVVLEKPLERVHRELDVIASPTGAPTAMVHCNNCTNEINAWAELFSQVISMAGTDCPKDRLFELLFTEADKGDKDCGGLTAVNYLSGEPVTAAENGCLLFEREIGSSFTIANFMRTQLYTALAALKYGMDILREENVQIDELFAHGGYFKTEGVGQRILAAAVNAPVSVMKTAGEGGAWGIALLAAYTAGSRNLSLGEYLNSVVFSSGEHTTVTPDSDTVKGFEKYMERYMKAVTNARVKP